MWGSRVVPWLVIESLYESSYSNFDDLSSLTSKVWISNFVCVRACAGVKGSS